MRLKELVEKIDRDWEKNNDKTERNEDRIISLENRVNALEKKEHTLSKEEAEQVRLLIRLYLDFKYRTGDMAECDFHSSIIHSFDVIYGNGIKGILNRVSDLEELAETNNLDKVGINIKEIKEIMYSNKNIIENQKRGVENFEKIYNIFSKIILTLGFFITIGVWLVRFGRESRNLEMRLIEVENKNKVEEINKSDKKYYYYNYKNGDSTEQLK